MQSKIVKRCQFLFLGAMGLNLAALVGIAIFVKKDIWTYIIIGALILLLAVICISLCYLYRDIRRPIEKLQDAMSAISAGNTDEPVALGEASELQVLSDELNMIRENLNQLGLEREKANTMTREVIGNITHDLKTPLTMIKGYSQGIIDGIARTPERMNKYVTTIRNKADDMSSLVDELSFFTLIYQNDIQYNLQDINANDYLSGCVSDLSLDLEMKKINLVYQYLADSNAMVRIDLDKVKRVINNIIGNASKYIDNDMGIVFVQVEENENTLLVQVQDNGVGIAEDEIPYVFERFYRTDSSRNSKTGGSGLGLAIAKKIIEDHGGRIWAESEQEKGTKIIFTLPKLIDETGKLC